MGVSRSGGRTVSRHDIKCRIVPGDANKHAAYAAQAVNCDSKRFLHKSNYFLLKIPKYNSISERGLLWFEIRLKVSQIFESVYGSYLFGGSQRALYSNSFGQSNLYDICKVVFSLLVMGLYCG